MRTWFYLKEICLLVALTLLVSTCKNYRDFEPVEGIDYGGEMAFPLIHGTTNLQDLIDEAEEENDLSGMVIHPDGSMDLSYETEATVERIADHYVMPGSFPLAIPQNNTTIPFSFFESMEVQQMNLKSGTISFELSATYSENIDVLISIPNLTKNGQTFSVTQTIFYTGSSPATAQVSPIDLQGYTLSPIVDALQLHYQAKDESGNDVAINPIFGMAENWTYDYIQGSWATDTFDLTNDTLQIELYDEWIDGEISFADPQLTLVIDNSFGTPVGASINEVRVRTANGESILLESEIFDNDIILNHPTLGEPDESKQTIIALNSTNSNIADILNAQPQQIIYNVTALVNPNNETNMIGFITDESAISLSLKTVLPVYGTASGFTIEEPLETDMEGFDEIESAELKLIVDNGLPIELGIQLYFLNDQGQKIDSLHTDYEHLVQSAAIDQDGMVTASKETISYVPISAERMEYIKASKRMMVGAAFSTANNGDVPVRIFTSHDMGIKAGIKVTFTNGE